MDQVPYMLANFTMSSTFDSLLELSPLTSHSYNSCHLQRKNAQDFVQLSRRPPCTHFLSLFLLIFLCLSSLSLFPVLSLTFAQPWRQFPGFNFSLGMCVFIQLASRAILYSLSLFQQVNTREGKTSH